MRSSAERTLRLWGSLAGVTCFCVQHYTLAHPFLLADNRCLFQECNALKKLASTPFQRVTWRCTGLACKRLIWPRVALARL